MLDDDRPTPKIGYPAESNPFDSQSRRPRVIVDRPSGRIHPRPDSEQDTDSNELNLIIDARIRRRNRFWIGVAGSLITGLIGLGIGSFKVYGDNRAYSERQAVRIELLEADIGKLKAARDKEREEQEREQREELRRLRAPFVAPQPKGPLYP